MKSLGKFSVMLAHQYQEILQEQEIPVEIIDSSNVHSLHSSHASARVEIVVPDEYIDQAKSAIRRLEIASKMRAEEIDQQFKSKLRQGISITVIVILLVMLVLLLTLKIFV